jgi:hypothetical protein
MVWELGKYSQNKLKFPRINSTTITVIYIIKSEHRTIGDIIALFPKCSLFTQTIKTWSTLIDNPIQTRIHYTRHHVPFVFFL